MGYLCTVYARLASTKSLGEPNLGGGVVVDGAGVAIVESSFVGGGNAANVPAVEIVSGVVEMSYTTVGAGFGTSSAVTCADDQQVSIRNSLLVSVSDEDEIQCASAVLTGCATELASGDNLELGDMDTAWFVGFSNGDFHLSGTQPEELATAAIWNTGDPTVDIDGDLRPTVDGDPDFAGADRL